MEIVNYTIRKGACPVNSWYAIKTLGAPLIGGQETQRTGFVRAKLDLDGTVLAIWDWVDRRWVEARLARRFTSIQTNDTELIV